MSLYTKKIDGICVSFTEHAIARFRERLHEFRLLPIPWEQIIQECKGKPNRKPIKVTYAGMTFVCWNNTARRIVVKTCYGAKKLQFGVRKVAIKWP